MQMNVYTDASFDEKRNIAGIGVNIKDGQKERVYSLWVPALSVNEAELFAIYIGGILSEGRGTVYTDSESALTYINRWTKDKPRTKEQYIRHKRCEMWAYKIRKLSIFPEKVKGHQHKFQQHALGNEMADLLAKAGRAKFYGK